MGRGMTGLILKAMRADDYVFTVLATEYSPPVTRSPSRRSASPIRGWRRFCESAFTGVSYRSLPGRAAHAAGPGLKSVR